MLANPCPATGTGASPGYVVNHVTANQKHVEHRLPPQRALPDRIMEPRHGLEDVVLNFNEPNCPGIIPSD